MLRAEVLDSSLHSLGPLPFLTLTIVARLNAVGSWTATVDGKNADAVSYVQPGNSLAVYRDGRSTPIMTGPIRKFGFSAADDSDVLTLNVSGSDDNVVLSWNAVYPNPALAAGAQLADTRYIQTGKLEQVWHDLVNLNAGQGVLTSRKRQLTVSALPTVVRGPVVTAQPARWARLDEFLPTLLQAAQLDDPTVSLAFRVQTIAGVRTFSIYAPQDVSASVRFERDLGTLRGYSFDSEMPKTTRAIAADSAGNTVIQTNAAAETEWGVAIENFGNSSAATDATTDAKKQLIADGPVGTVSTNPVATSEMRYGIDYDLGDTVSVAGIKDVVRQVTIAATNSGPTTETPLIGTDPSTDPNVPAIYEMVRQLRQRVALLEST